ncbi:MAG: GGDEF domain-containing protein [Pseudodesulfovibrio sp.]
MATDTLVRLFRICREMDATAQRTFKVLSATADGPGLGAWWAEAAGERAGRVAFWDALIPLAERGMIPAMFDEPEAMADGLGRALDSARDLAAQREPGQGAGAGFVIAARLEYCLPHPSFESFFLYARELSPVARAVPPGNPCAGGVERLGDALARFCSEDPAMELLGDVVRTLWTDNHRLGQAMNSDVLTGVMNRRGFFNAARPFLDLARRNGKNLGLILAEIDDFTVYVATHGREAADALLQRIGLALKQVVRSSDLVARFGGGEFVVLFYALGGSNLLDVAEKMHRTIDVCSQGGPPCTASLGAASLGSPGPGGGPCVNLEEVMAQATLNREAARSRGGGRAVVS